MPVRFLVALWLPWAVSLSLGLHLSSSAFLVAAAWAFRRDRLGLHVAVGMSFGWVGDIFMAGEDLVMGILAFSVNHVAYVRGFWGEWRRPAASTDFVPWALWTAIGVAGWYLVVFQGVTPSKALTWAALVYTLLLCASAGSAGGLALQQPRFTLLALGTALFLASDLLIGMRIFNPPLLRQLSALRPEKLVWWLYGTGQMLIVYSRTSELIRTERKTSMA